MSIEYRPEAVRCEAWNWIEAALTDVEEHDYDAGFKFMQFVLGFDYSERLGGLVEADVKTLWEDIKLKMKPEEC